MNYRGHIWVYGDDISTGVEATVTIDDNRVLSIVSRGDSLGSWPLDQVAVHTTATLVQREATTQVVQAAMRHSDYSTTFEVYGHMQAGITDLAAEAIDRQVAAAGAPIMRPPGMAEVIELPAN